MTTWIIIILIGFIITLVTILILPSKIKISSTSIIIGKVLAIEISFKDIEDVRLNTSYPKTAHKIYGLDSGNVKKGIFKTPEGHQVRLHIFQEHPPFIEVIYAKGLLVFNSKSPKKTEHLYLDLISKLEFKSY
jgi:hypothetical protein